MSARKRLEEREKRQRHLYCSATAALADVFRALNVPWALCGDSAFAAFYDAGKNASAPQDIELMTMSPDKSDLDDLKREFANRNRASFCFRKPKLWYRESDQPESPRIEVILSISATKLAPSLVHEEDGMPVAPFQFLLLQKLSAWDSDSASASARNQYALAVHQMLNRCDLTKARASVSGDESSGASFRDSLRDAAVKFCAQFPGAAEKWTLLGFSFQQPESASGLSNDDATAAAKQAPEPDAPAPASPAPAPPRSPSSGKESRRAPIRRRRGTASSSGGADALQKDFASLSLRPSAPRRLSHVQIRCNAARAAIDVLRQLGFASAVSGSMACHLYGSPHVPDDVTMLAVPAFERPTTSQELKEISSSMARSDAEHFFIKAAPEKELWYTSDRREREPNPSMSCRVSVHGHPGLSANAIVWHKSHNMVFPLAPFEVLFVHKLEEWDDHLRVPDTACIDAEELRWMLKNADLLTWRLSSYVYREELWSDRSLFSRDFISLTRDRVQRFRLMFPGHDREWTALRLT